MIYRTLRKLATERGWHQSRSWVTGFEKGFMVGLADAQGCKYIALNNLKMPAESTSAIENKLKAKAQHFKLGKILVTSDEILVSLPEIIIPARAGTIAAAISLIISLLEAENIPHNDLCQRCGARNFKFYYLSNQDLNFPLCDRCAQIGDDAISQEQIRDGEEQKKYLNGFFGAVSFSFACTIFWPLLDYFFGPIAALVSGFIPILSEKGYEVFGGKLGLWKPWIILSAGILMLFLSVLVVVVFFALTKHGVAISLMPGFLISHLIAIASSRELIMAFGFAAMLWLIRLPILIRAQEFPRLILSKQLRKSRRI